MENLENISKKNLEKALEVIEELKIREFDNK